MKTNLIQNSCHFILQLFSVTQPTLSSQFYLFKLYAVCFNKHKSITSQLSIDNNHALHLKSQNSNLGMYILYNFINKYNYIFILNYTIFIPVTSVKLYNIYTYYAPSHKCYTPLSYGLPPQTKNCVM